MNTASQNLPHHLGLLRERLQHPTDYEKAIHYFLEEFGGDVDFMKQSLPEDAPHLLAVVRHVAGRFLGRPAAIDDSRVFHLAAFRFYHGNAAIAGRVVLFHYFEEIDTGVAALVPGVEGGMAVARFRLTTGLMKPKNN